MAHKLSLFVCIVLGKFVETCIIEEKCAGSMNMNFEIIMYQTEDG